ncbi:peptidoglycan/LPS O-acetylase OafA/YrhL [Bradyrhizobium sp. USDA 4449]
MRLKFLDGMRGWASVFVVLFHVFVDGLPPVPWATHLRYVLPFNGGMAVFCFFVISAISLSVGYLTSGEIGGIARIAAARYIRLAIPVFAICLLVHLVLLSGWLDTPDRLPHFRFLFQFEPTLRHLLTFGLFDVFFRYSPLETYAGPLWTMQPEMWGSMITLAAAIIVRRIRFRLAVLASLAAILFYLAESSTSQMLAIFPLGIALADAMLRGWLNRMSAFVAALAVIAGGALIPMLFPYSVLAWGMIAAPLLIAGSISLPSIRNLMSNPISEWLGWLSFPLYLVHGPVISMLGEPMMRNNPPIARGLAVDGLVIVSSIAAAILFAHLVNDPAVRLARWFGSVITARLRLQASAA